MSTTRVVVYFLSGKQHTFYMDNGTSVLDLKRQLKRQIGVPKAAMSILHEGGASILPDGEALEIFGTTAPWFQIADLVHLQDQPLHSEFYAVLRFPMCSKCGKESDVGSFL